MKTGAIFDMDGLMFDTESLYQNAWRQEARRMGITLGDDFVMEICGTNGDLLLSIVKKYYHTDDPIRIRDAVIQSVEDHLRQEVPVKPGLFEILKYLKEQGVKLAVASSSYPALIRRNLANSDTEPYFDAVVSGTNVPNGKPAPDIFLFAADQLGIDPKDCYVFEDSINGVHAGLAAGCETVMVPDYVGPDETVLRSRATVCASLNEALEKIRSGSL